MGNCNCHNGASHGTKTCCVECDIPQLARNNYFTGKLLVERDFTDEQRYFMGKERRHNQRLHGWGAVCGLKVLPHPNPACADRFVLIDPGTAIDCCGREILVLSQECFDFRSRLLDYWQTQNGPNTQPGAAPMDIQICVSYRECGAEEVPALFDDCSSDARSHPNRILESHKFDVLVKPAGATPETGGVELKWLSTLNFADAIRVVRHDATKRVYLLTSNSSAAVLYALDATTGSVEMPPQTFTASAGLDLAVSPAGDFIYVAIQPSAAGSAPEIVVCKEADLSIGNTVNLGPAGDSGIGLGVAPDGSVISIGQTSGVLVWDSSLNSSSSAIGTAVAGINKPVALAISPAGSFAYVASNATSSISAIDLTSSAFAVTTFPVGTSPTKLAVASTTAGDTLAALDFSGTPTLYFVSLASGPGSPKALGQVTGFANPPVDVKLSPGGAWAYVLESDATGKVFVQPANEHAVELGLTNVLGSAIGVGSGAASESLATDGSILYIPYAGSATLAGAVAVIDVEQSDCGDLFKQAIEPCPDCDDGNCIVLATITGYVFGNPVTAAQIDNLTDRHILASTSLLTDVVRCLLNGAGQGSGEQGPPGQPGQNGGAGPAGPGIDQVSVTFVPCDTPGSATITGVSPARTLQLVIPGDCNKDLTGIAGVTWDHNGNTVTFGTLNKGLGIAFSAPVQAADLTVNSLAILAPIVNQSFTTWAEVALLITPGDFATAGDATSSFSPNPAATVNGVFIKPANAVAVREIEDLNAAQLRIVVKGDFIRDASANMRAIDGDHLPPWLPKRPTGDGIAGGTFESWISINKG